MIYPGDINTRVYTDTQIILIPGYIPGYGYSGCGQDNRGRYPGVPKYVPGTYTLLNTPLEDLEKYGKIGTFFGISKRPFYPRSSWFRSWHQVGGLYYAVTRS